MSNERFVNIVRIIVKFNSEIDQVLPDNLKCVMCRSALKEACQGPCGCRLCRVCIDHTLVNGEDFCPGTSEECSGSSLLEFVTDFIANNSIGRLVIKCPQNECQYKCQVARMEDHMQVCSRRREQCPFHELGCTWDQLAAEEIGGHLQQEYRRHSEILIDMIAKINRQTEHNTRELGLLKQSQEDKIREIDMLKQNDECNKREIETLKQNEEDRQREIETLKSELVLKYEEISTITEQMIHVTNENKSVKDEIKSIKEERESLQHLVTSLTEKMEKEVNERRETEEVGSGVILEYVDREVSSITSTVRSNRKEIDTEMKSVKDESKLINDTVKSEFKIIKSRIQTIEALVRLGPIDATCEWVIDGDVGKRGWSSTPKTSRYFQVTAHSNKYAMVSLNDVGSSGDSKLAIDLRIYRGPEDEDLQWPFIGTVIITVSDKTRRESCRSIALLCRIWRPTNTGWNGCSDQFIFPHSELIGAGIDLSGGVRVSCVIVRDMGP